MVQGPLQIGGWTQGIYEASATQKEELGVLRFEHQRAYRYGKATAVALIPGVVIQLAAPTANHINRSAITTAVGATEVEITVGNTAVAAGDYKNGFLQINAGTAGTLGHSLLISDHTTASGNGTIQVQLAEPLPKALVATTDKLSLIPNPYLGVSEGAVQKPCGGQAVANVPASNYAWFQTGGVGCVILANATAIGSYLIPGATGSLKLFVVDYLQPAVAQCLQTGVTSEYKPVLWMID